MISPRKVIYILIMAVSLTFTACSLEDDPDIGSIPEFDASGDAVKTESVSKTENASDEDYPYALVRPSGNGLKVIAYLDSIPYKQTAFDIYGNEYRFQYEGNFDQSVASAVLYINYNDGKEGAALTGYSVVPRKYVNRY